MPGERLPTIFQLHGGPVAQFAHEFDLEAELFAAQGYAVYSLNPRGSSGRGLAFAKAIWRDWGGPDVADVRAGIAHAVADGIADKDRIGVWGWSYGGVLANYMIASEPSLKAAVAGAGIGNEISMYGTDLYAREYETEWGTPWDETELWLKLSYPFFHARRIKTPTLYQCAENDHNVPCAGSEQMYLALRSLGIPTQLVVYPGESHGISRPSYLVDYMQRNLEWIGHWLRK